MSTPLSLEALEVLDAIDRKGSFAAAAAALYRVPSAITYSVGKLEEDLGVTLFRREGRRSVLTPAGQVLLEQGRELLEAAERLVETTRQVERGWESTLAITLDSIYGFGTIAPHLEALYALRPDIEVTLSEEVLGGAWEAVLDGRTDLVIGASEPEGSTQGLSSRAIDQCGWCFAVAPGHPLAAEQAPLREEQIREHRAVVVRDSSRRLPPRSRRVFETQSVLRVQTVEQKIAAQAAGLGAGFLPRHRIEEHLRQGVLVALPLQQEEEDAPLHLVWRRGERGRALRWLLARFD